MFAASNVHFELADKTRGIATGGIGVAHRLAQEIGLVDAIDRRLHLLKIHMPYHESDHVLNLAYNALCDGTCLEDIELRRNNEVFLDALGTERIPDPTTAGDFCRRFDEGDIRSLMIVLRKNISHEKGEKRLFDEIRYFFYIANDWAVDAEDVVFEANDRCDQENLIAQLAGGVRALSAPVRSATAATSGVKHVPPGIRQSWAAALPHSTNSPLRSRTAIADGRRSLQ